MGALHTIEITQSTAKKKILEYINQIIDDNCFYQMERILDHMYYDDNYNCVIVGDTDMNDDKKIL